LGRADRTREGYRMTMPATDFPAQLPGVLAEIAEIAGGAAALQVADAKGGLEKVHIPLPGNLREGHWLVDAVGMNHAQAIARRLGGAKIDIPFGPFAGQRKRTHAAIRQGIAEGSSPAAIARATGVHQRTARRHRTGKSDADGPQIALPFNVR
jgi:hypothetical protein